MDKEQAPKKESKKEESSELEQLKQEFKECQKTKKEYLEGWQRSKAEFLNYKKQEMEKMSEFLEKGRQELILKILPIFDNLERGFEGLSEKDREGLMQVKKQFKDFLEDQGLKEIEAQGKEFDPNFHQALEQVEGEEQESGTVIEVLEKGYKLKDKVIRPARVKVAK